MKDKQMFQIQLNPASLDFILRPISIAVRGAQEGIYHLELEKGIQHIKNFQQTISARNIHSYTFKNMEQMRVKMHSIKSADLTWSLYKTFKDTEEYIDSIKLDMSEFYRIYTEEIKKYPHQFRHIIEDKHNNKQWIKSWRNMKFLLTNKYYFIKDVSNKFGNFTIRYSLEIKSQLDYLSEKYQSKCQITTKASMQSGKSSKSSSSLNSLKWKLKVQKINQQNQSQKSLSQKEYHIQLKKQNEPPNFGSPLHTNLSDIQSNVAQEAGTVHNQGSQQTKGIIPHLRLLNIEQTVLSDIIENSHEGSMTTMNQTNFGDRTDRTKTELNLVKEQPIIKQKNTFMRNTYTYTKPEQMDPSFKRINTTTHFLEQSDLTANQAKLQDSYNHQFAPTLEQSIQNRSKQSFDKDLSTKQKDNKQKTHNSPQVIKSIVLVLIILTIFLVSAQAIKPLRHKFNQNIKENQRQGKLRPNKTRQNAF